VFIVCFDKDLIEKLKSSGFKLLNQYDGKATFVYDKSIKFNFDKVDKAKFMITNRLTF
jgi:hypothetical protein